MPFNYRSPRLKTPLGSFGFFHIFGGGRRRSSGSSPPPPKSRQQCGNCGYTWTPRGRDVSIRCPNCGTKFTEVVAVPPAGSDAGSSIIGCLGTLILVPVTIVALCAGAAFFVGMVGSYQAEPPVASPRANESVDSPAVAQPEPAIEASTESPVQAASPPDLPPTNEQESNANLHTFTDKSGQYTTRAEFVEFRFQGSRVILRKADGTEVDISMNDLSREDQSWVRDEVKRRAALRKASDSEP